MKEDVNNIDKLFKENLGDIKIKPSRAVWKGIRAKYFNALPGKMGFLNFQNIFLGLIITGTCVSLVSIILQVIFTGNHALPYNTQEAISLSFYTSPKPGPLLADERVGSDKLTGTHPKNEKNKATISSSIPTSVENKSTQTVVKKGEISSSKHMINAKYPDPAHDAFNEKHQEAPNYSQPLQQTQMPVNDNKMVTGESVGLQAFKTAQVPFMRLMPANILTAYTPKIETKTGNPMTPLQWKDDKGQKASFELGIQFMDEWTDYRLGAKNFKKGYDINLSGIWHFKELFIRGGLGVGFSDDNGDYTVNYERYDSVGFYYKVNYFTISPGSSDSVDLITIIQTVYDSVYHADLLQPRNRYTYLQIPLSLGFDFYTYRRLSLSLMVGPVLSILVHENETPATLNDPRAKLVDVINRTPDRIKANVQLAAALGIRYQFNNKLALGLEPTYKYFIRPAYDVMNVNLKKPYSIGIKATLFIKL